MMTADRMPPLTDEAMTDAQRRCAREIAAGPRGGVYGPFVPLLRSPELAGHDWHRPPQPAAEKPGAKKSPARR